MSRRVRQIVLPRFLCSVVRVTFLVEHAAAVNTVVPKVKVACDGAVAVGCQISSLLGSSVEMLEGRGGGVCMFRQVHVIGEQTGRRTARRPDRTLAIHTFYRLRILFDITL